jgi:hypothetical protein
LSGIFRTRVRRDKTDTISPPFRGEFVRVRFLLWSEAVIHRSKRIADTSRAALADIRQSRGQRETAVLEALGGYRHVHSTDPTAYELLRWMQINWPALDLNAVRPRLTELRDRHQVHTSGKRVCAVTQKLAYTWALGRGELDVRPFRDADQHAAAAVQEGLF